MQPDHKLATDPRRLTHLIALAEEGRFCAPQSGST